MPEWVQHILVLTLVAAALVITIRQAVGALRLKRSKLGSCCAKGCEADSAKASDDRIVFLPVDSLRARRG